MKHNVATNLQRLGKSSLAPYGNFVRRTNLLQCRNTTTGSRPFTKRTKRTSEHWRFASIGAVATASLFAIFTITSGARLAYAEQPPQVESTTAKPSTCPLSTMPVVFYDTSTENLNDVIAELSKLLGAHRVDLNLGSRISHSSTEWSPAPRGELDRFDIVVSPSNTEEVSAIAKICHRRRIPMTAFSGGTSLEGTLAATQGGVCIDFKLMNKIITVRKNDLDATVQPGVGYMDLNQKLAEEGLFFPPDPGPGAQIGGMMYVCTYPSAEGAC